MPQVQCRRWSICESPPPHGEYPTNGGHTVPQILTGSADRSVRLYNPSKASATRAGSGLIQTYSAHGYEVLDLAVTDDNARFASVGGDKQVLVWDVATARTLKRWSGHFGRVNCVGFAGDGAGVVVSGSFDATVRLWDCKSQSVKPIQVLGEARDSVSGLHVVGHEIVTGSVDGRLRVYDLRMGMLFVDVIGRGTPVWLHRGTPYTDSACLQNQLRRYSKREMGMLFSSPLSTPPSVSWIRPMANSCRATGATRIRIIGFDLVWAWLTPL